MLEPTLVVSARPTMMNSQPTGLSGRFQATTKPTLGNDRKIVRKARSSRGDGGFGSPPGIQSDSTATPTMRTHTASSAAATARDRVHIGSGAGERLVLALDDADRLVEAREREDLAVVLRETEGHQALAMALGADEERHEQADPRAVHVLEA